MIIKRPAESEAHQERSLEHAGMVEISEPRPLEPRALGRPEPTQAFLTVGVN